MIKRLLLVKFTFIAIGLLMFTNTQAQIGYEDIPDVGRKFVIKFLTPDKLPDMTNSAKYCSYYIKATNTFINAPDCNWSNTTTSPYTAYIEGTSGKPMLFRIGGGIFEPTTDPSWNLIMRGNRISFRGWNGKNYSIVVSDFMK